MYQQRWKFATALQIALGTHWIGASAAAHAVKAPLIEWYGVPLRMTPIAAGQLSLQTLRNATAPKLARGSLETGPHALVSVAKALSPEVCRALQAAAQIALSPRQNRSGLASRMLKRQAAGRGLLAIGPHVMRAVAMAGDRESYSAAAKAAQDRGQRNTSHVRRVSGVLG
jgi:hypothetical protein